MPTLYDSKHDKRNKNTDVYEKEDDIKNDQDRNHGNDDEDEHRIIETPKSKDMRDDSTKLDDAVKSANRVLFRARAIFPFDFFPNEVIIDENKINIVEYNFFYSKEIYTIPVQNINAVTSSFNLFFGELRIEAWGIDRMPKPINFLTKADAQTARRIVSGLILANNDKIDIRNIPLKEAKLKLNQIGKSQQEVN